AEDGIRGCHVTGVQTCALPICFCFPSFLFNHFGEYAIGSLKSYSLYRRLYSQGQSRIFFPERSVDAHGEIALYETFRIFTDYLFLICCCIWPAREFWYF